MQIPQDLIETAALKLKSVKSEAEFFQLRAKYLGKKSFVVTSFTKLRDLESDKKVIAAKRLNVLKNELTKLFETSFADIEVKSNNAKLDVTLPADPFLIGSEHPITKISKKIINYFTVLNYQIFSGNEIETDFYNFEALNFPENHPARQMHDTFYLNTNSRPEYLLRSIPQILKCMQCFQKTYPYICFLLEEYLDVTLIPLIYQCLLKLRVW